MFATGANFPTNLIVSSDGSLYYLSRGIGTGVPGTGTGQLFKIRIRLTRRPASFHRRRPIRWYRSVIRPLSACRQPALRRLRISGSETAADIPTAIRPRYTMPATTMADNGAQYRVVVTNPYGDCHQQRGRAVGDHHPAPDGHDRFARRRNHLRGRAIVPLRG